MGVKNSKPLCFKNLNECQYLTGLIESFKGCEIQKPKKPFIFSIRGAALFFEQQVKQQQLKCCHETFQQFICPTCQQSLCQKKFCEFGCYGETTYQKNTACSDLKTYLENSALEFDQNLEKSIDEGLKDLLENYTKYPGVVNDRGSYELTFTTEELKALYEED